mgnify:CR=1 FL=1
MFVFSIVVRTTSKPLIICSNWQKFIGDYPEELFIEGPAKAAIEVFQRKLKGISAEIKARNAKLCVPYPYLLPEQIPNSVAIWASKEKENSPVSLVERRSMLWLDKIDWFVDCRHESSIVEGESVGHLFHAYIPYNICIQYLHLVPPFRCCWRLLIFVCGVKFWLCVGVLG